MNAHHPLPYSPDVEVVPPDEAEDIRQMIEVMRDLLIRDRQSSGEKRRDVHVKSHGCPVGHFEVLPGLPAELQQGLCEHPRTYPVAVRFSNSSPQPLPDAVPDGRGVAIKVRDVPGPMLSEATTDAGVQDFVMVNNPTFLVANVKDYLRLQRTRLEGVRRPQVAVKTFTGGNWDPRQWRWGGAFSAARIVAQGPVHPAHLTYYSMSPFRFGDYVVKYRLKPTSSTLALRWSRSLLLHADAFRLGFAEMLRSSSMTFEFQVQLRTDARSMPIEDATVAWPESQSPYRTVARLVIPSQDLTASPFRRGEELSFNVWNCLEAHRPLGGINRSRRAAYQLSASWRRNSLPE